MLRSSGGECEDRANEGAVEVRSGEEAISDNEIDEIELELICPVCLEPYSIDLCCPVELVSCGHTCCESCFQMEFKIRKRYVCPVCRGPYKGMRPANDLRDAIRKLQLGGGESSSGDDPGTGAVREAVDMIKRIKRQGSIDNRSGRRASTDGGAYQAGESVESNFSTADDIQQESTTRSSAFDADDEQEFDEGARTEVSDNSSEVSDHDTLRRTGGKRDVAQAGPASSNDTRRRNTTFDPYFHLSAQGSFKVNEVIRDKCLYAAYVVDNSGSMTMVYDGRTYTQQKDFTIVKRGSLLRWHEAACRVFQIADYNIRRNMRATYYLLNPINIEGLDPPVWKDGDDFVTIDPSDDGDVIERQLASLKKMLDQSNVRGTTPLDAVLKHFLEELQTHVDLVTCPKYIQDIQGGMLTSTDFEDSVVNLVIDEGSGTKDEGTESEQGQGDVEDGSRRAPYLGNISGYNTNKRKNRKVVAINLNIITDGEPNDKNKMEQAFRSLIDTYTIFVTINLCTDDWELVEYYNTLDSVLGCGVGGVDVIDDLKSELVDVRRAGNDFFTYSFDVHVARMAGCFSIVADTMDESRFSSNLVNKLVKELLSVDELPPWSDREHYLAAVSELLQVKEPVYDFERRRFVPIIHLEKLRLIMQREDFVSGCQSKLCLSPIPAGWLFDSANAILRLIGFGQSSRDTKSYVRLGDWIKDLDDSQMDRSGGSSGSRTSDGSYGAGDDDDDANSSEDAADEMFTAQDVASHSEETDCWVVIDSGVYDATSVLPMLDDPDRDVIIDHAGRDVTYAIDAMDATRGKEIRRKLARCRLGAFTAKADFIF